MYEIMRQQKGETRSVATLIDNKKIKENEKKIIPIIKTVIFCARQNIPMRGHRDDSKHLEEPHSNPGNFQSFFRIDSGDNLFQNHFQTCVKNASYRSKTIQNEIITCIGDVIIH